MNAITTPNANTLTAGGDLQNRFFSYLDVKPRTLDTYAKALKQFFICLSCKGIQQPTREDVVAYREELKATHKPTTVQSYITVVKLFFRWTAQEGLYPNIADHLKGAKIDRNHKKDYLTSKQVKNVMQGIGQDSEQGKRDYAMVALMVTGGLRTIEVARANIEDLRTLGDYTVLYVQGKGKDEKSEYIKVNDNVERAIRAYLQARGNASPADPLFVSTSNNSKGNRMTTRSISAIAKTAIENGGYKSDRLTAHSLRHTAVTLSLLAGQKLEDVQQHARHSNIATTMIYNHALDRAKNGCSDAVAGLIF